MAALRSLLFFEIDRNGLLRANNVDIEVNNFIWRRGYDFQENYEYSVYNTNSYLLTHGSVNLFSNLFYNDSDTHNNMN